MAGRLAAGARGRARRMTAAANWWISVAVLAAALNTAAARHAGGGAEAAVGVRPGGPGGGWCAAVRSAAAGMLLERARPGERLAGGGSACEALIGADGRPALWLEPAGGCGCEPPGGRGAGEPLADLRLETSAPLAAAGASVRLYAAAGR